MDVLQGLMMVSSTFFHILGAVLMTYVIWKW
jgi:hypothetical protein